MKPSLISRLRQYFLAGLLALLPLFITWQILSLLWSMVDGFLGRHLNRFIQAVTPVEIYIPGLGFAVTLVIVLCFGWLMRTVVFKRLMDRVEAFIDRIPLVRSLYNASRQIVVPFTDRSKLPFSKVVLVEYPMPGRQTLGLVAKERLTDHPDDDRMVVFFPTNHLHLGYPVVLSRHEVVPIDMTVEDAIKFFVSCGVIGDEHLLRSGGEIVPPRPRGTLSEVLGQRFDLPA